MKIVCLGDSTMQYNDSTTFPQVGWVQALEEKLNRDVRLLNFAKNGRSTKTFLQEGRFEDALRFTDAGDIVLIGFGHNDSHVGKSEYTDPNGEYADNLAFMVNECRKKGAYVLLLTPVYRRWFNEDGSIRNDCHAGYRESVLQVGKETKSDVVDLCLLSKERIALTGKEASKAFFMNFPAGVYDNYPGGLEDNTHLRMAGAKMVTDLFLEAVKDNPHFKECFNV